MRSVSRTYRVSDSAFRLGLFAWDRVENHACHRRREHQILAFNPASSVRGPKYVVKTGKPPVLSAKEARTLLDGIDVSTVVGLRDRAFLGVLVYSFAQVSAAVALRVADYYTQGPRAFFRLHEKGGRYNVVPPITPPKPTSTHTWKPPTLARTAADRCSAAASRGGAMLSRIGRCRA